ncbi:MAG: tetratricopeptide repeat protein [Pyrinomonadaceae bacterium]|nr:tetratricopeptide repeat protein [Sphingobacteriaceae bacterium]
MNFRYWVIIGVVSSIIIFILIDLQKKSINTRDKAIGNNQFIGDVNCKSCHAKEYNDWQTSHHFKAIQPANDSTVKGDFNDVVFISDGVTSKFFKKGNKFFINTQGEDGKNYDYEIKYTFGFTPLQQYLIEFPGGRMQVTRASWDTKKEKWFNQYKGQNIPAGDWLHWTGNAQNWNTMCADCHSTNLKKNYDLESDTYNTTHSILNVSCEACHGAAKNHVDYIKGEYKQGERVKGSLLELPKNAGQIAQINTCAPCHARRSMISNNKLVSSELLDNFIPEIPSNENFHEDGQVKEENYIYTSFLQSKMFGAGVKCSNCHNPHSGKLILTANNLCLKCHQKKYNEPAHTFHAVNTVGSECVSCHMPGEYFMGNDFRHDHSVRVPRPDLSVKYGTPNACNNCHGDKSTQWAADAVSKWYGPARKYHFAEDLIPGSRAGANSELHLLKLLRNTGVPSIVKATASHYLANVPSPDGLKALLNGLKEKDAHIRYRALRSLVNFDSREWLEEAAPLLRDPVRAVRVAAADMFLTVPPDQLSSGTNAAFSAAKKDLNDYLYSQADFSVGNIMLGDYFLQLQDNANAAKFYLRGLKKDSLMNLARINLSVVYNLQGNNKHALQVLKTAEKIDPENERIYFNIGLLYHEMKDSPNAMINFEKAVQLKSPNPRVYYNYGLLLLSTNAKKAEAILQKGLTFSTEDAGLHYALAYLYLNQKQPLKAIKHALVLKKTDPNNPEYSAIFSALRML